MTLLTAIPTDPLPSDPAERVLATRTGTNRVVYSPTGRLLATGDVRMNVVVRQGSEVVYEANFESLNEKIRATDRIRGLVFAEDESELWVAAGDSIRVIRLADGAEIMSYTPPRSFGFLIISPIALTIDPKGRVAAAFDDGSIAVWHSSREKEVLWKDNDSPRTLDFTREGRLLVGTDSFTLCAWETESRRKALRLTLPDRAYGAAVAPTGDHVVTRHLSHASLWRLEHSEPLGKFPVEAGLPLVAFHPLRPWVAFGSVRAVDLFDLAGQRVARFPVDGSNVVSFGFSPDGARLTVGCLDDSLREFALP